MSEMRIRLRWGYALMKVVLVWCWGGVGVRAMGEHDRPGECCSLTIQGYAFMTKLISQPKSDELVPITITVNPQTRSWLSCGILVRTPRQ
jgi:hypothetical protein